MKRFLTVFVLFFALCVTLYAGDSPKYVFFFIGDGMSPNLVRAAEQVEQLSFVNFPVKTKVTTHSADKAITDSAASATALAAGVKTDNGFVGLDPAGNRLETLSDVAQKSGRKVGIITTVGVNHATPAGFYGKQNARGKYDEIIADFYTSSVDYLAGAPIIGKVKIEEAAAKSKPRKIETFEFDYAYLKGENTLATLLARALENVDGSSGFFLMSEGGMIDYAAHDNHLRYAIAEIISFDQAIRLAEAFMVKHPDETLIVVTSDHDTGGLLLMDHFSALDFWKKTFESKAADIRLAEDSGLKWTTGGHAATPVWVFAKGKGAEVFAGVKDNTDVAKEFKKLLQK